eukprot:363970-Chlamydomonas_euryale.AAC.3
MRATGRLAAAADGRAAHRQLAPTEPPVPHQVAGGRPAAQRPQPQQEPHRLHAVARSARGFGQSSPPPPRRRSSASKRKGSPRKHQPQQQQLQQQAEGSAGAVDYEAPDTLYAGPTALIPFVGPVELALLSSKQQDAVAGCF